MKRYYEKALTLEELKSKIEERFEDAVEFVPEDGTCMITGKGDEKPYMVIGKKFGNYYSYRVVYHYDQWCLKYIGY